jgi:hypothetical protein
MYGLAIIGGGPAGTGPLVWAAQNGKLHSWLDDGVVVIERTGAMGGTLGSYIVNADSLSTSFFECIDTPWSRDLFAAVRETEAARWLEQHRYEYPPLRLVARFLVSLGEVLERVLREHSACRFLPHTTAQSLHLNPDGSATVRLEGGRAITARNVVMALGGHQDRERAFAAELVPGLRLSDVDDAKIVPSGRFLTPEGLAEARHILARQKSARTIVIGGAHSAFSAAWALLNALPDAPFAEGDVTVLHRRPPRVTYADPAAAAADGYGFAESDICPFTRRVHRLGGIRNDGREVWRRLSGRPSALPEPRAGMMSVLDPGLSRDRLLAMLDAAALIVPALGYRLNTIPVFGATGRRLPLLAEREQGAVSPASRLLLADGSELSNVYGVGLGSGFRPHGDMAGEPSFDGQQNSLWLFQNGLGRLIYEGVHETAEVSVRPARVARPAKLALA